MSKKTTTSTESDSAKSASGAAPSAPEGSTPAAAAVVDLSRKPIQDAIGQGRALITEGKSKADAARAIFTAISGESKEVIVAAFVEGATLTPKGALTYWYNCKRRASKQN